MRAAFRLYPVNQLHGTHVINTRVKAHFTKKEQFLFFNGGLQAADGFASV